MTANEPESRKLLGIYLNDHLMGATGGADLARRTAGENADTSYAGTLQELSAEIAEDRRTLLGLMQALGIRVDRVKVVVGAVGERLSRLKPNGQLTGYSPLSRVIELEGLHGGVSAKQRMWRTLQDLERTGADVGQVDLGGLVARAQHQLERLEELHGRAVIDAFGDM